MLARLHEQQTVRGYLGRVHGSPQQHPDSRLSSGRLAQTRGQLALQLGRDLIGGHTGVQEGILGRKGLARIAVVQLGQKLASCVPLLIPGHHGSTGISPSIANTCTCIAVNPDHLQQDAQWLSKQGQTGPTQLHQKGIV